MIMNFAFSSPAENLEASSAAWLRDLAERGCSPRTITGYALTVRDFIECFATEEDNPSAPSYADVLLWTQTFDARGPTQRTRQQYLVRLRTFFTWACEHGWYQVNPVLKRLLPSPSDLPPKEYVELGKWQLQQLYTFTRPGYARTVTYPRNYTIVILLLTTDLRNNELLHLTPAALRWSDNQIFVSCGNSGSVRRVAFPELAQSAVRLYLASGIRPQDLPDTAPLFGTTSKKGVFGTRERDGAWTVGSAEWLSALVMRHVKAVTGVSGVRCEDLRHIGRGAESLSLEETRVRQARRNAYLLERMKNRP